MSNRECNVEAYLACQTLNQSRAEQWDNFCDLFDEVIKCNFRVDPAVCTMTAVRVTTTHPLISTALGFKHLLGLLERKIQIKTLKSNPDSDFIKVLDLPSDLVLLIREEPQYESYYDPETYRNYYGFYARVGILRKSQVPDEYRRKFNYPGSN